MKKQKDHAKDQAKAQFDTITCLMSDLRHNEIEEATEAIENNALEVRINTGWHTVGYDAPEPEQYEILLCFGGPTVKIRGDIEDFTPTTARLMYQDWGTELTEYILEGEESALLLEYAQQYCYGA